MILSVSRRTDIPAFYAEWFMNRLREGFALARNPMNYHQVSRVSLTPDAVDCIVFWTKDAAPMLPCIDAIAERYAFYFQYTLNAYDESVEPNLPPLDEKTSTFRRLSEKIGPHRVVWRYDPILMAGAIDASWHIDRFRRLAEALDGATHTCVFSFVDMYAKIRAGMRELGARACAVDEERRLAGAFAEIAAAHGIALQTCAEEIDLAAYGIRRGSCIDGALISRLTGYEIAAKRDGNQRGACGCLESVDIGQYDTCGHGCRYCYANRTARGVESRPIRHDPTSPLLVGWPEPDDRITERRARSLRVK